MEYRDFLNAFIEHCREYGYGSPYDQHDAIDSFLAAQTIRCPYCGAEAHFGYTLICTCPVVYGTGTLKPWLPGTRLAYTQTSDGKYRWVPIDKP